MSVDVMSRVWRDSPQKANKLLVLLAIADIADDYGWAYPAHNTLAKKCRVGRRAIQKILDDLEQRGEILIYNRFDQKTPEQHFSNVYHLAKYGAPDASMPTELRGVIRRRCPGSEQSDATGVVNTETLGGSVQPDTRVVNGETLPSVQPDTRVVNSGSHYSLQEPSVTPSQDKSRAVRAPTYGMKVDLALVEGAGGSIRFDDGALLEAVERPQFISAALAIYKTYWDMLEELGRAAAGGMELAWKKHEPAALALALARLSPEEVERYMVAQYRGDDPFWQNKPIAMSLQHIAEHIRAWQSRTPTRAAPAPNGKHAPLTPVVKEFRPSQDVSLGVPERSERRAKTS